MSVEQRITCSEFIKFLNDYVDGSLPCDRQAVFDQHITRCTACVDYLESYRHTVQLVEKVAQFNNSPEDAPSDLVSAILAARRV